MYANHVQASTSNDVTTTCYKVHLLSYLFQRAKKGGSKVNHYPFGS